MVGGRVVKTIAQLPALAAPWPPCVQALRIHTLSVAHLPYVPCLHPNVVLLRWVAVHYVQMLQLTSPLQCMAEMEMSFCDISMKLNRM